MRSSIAAALAVSLLALVQAPAGASASPAPSCAEGPTTVGQTILGTPCADQIVAAPGVETVKGGGGDDTIVAAPITASAPCPEGCRLGVGSQTYEGGPGDDIVFGERGNDILRGGEGNDRLYGGIGDDLLEGGPGDDLLSGGFGADSIDGQAGDDYVHGDGTIDRIFDTGGGSDTLSYATGITPGFGGTVTGFGEFPSPSGERGLRLDLGAGGQNANNGVAPFGGGVDEVEAQSFETVIGTPFSDYIVGTAADQTIHGGGGADVILGGGGSDNLDGGAGGDYVDGGAAVARDSSKISVGLMAPGETAYSQLYLVGSSAADSVTATYAPGPPASVAFTLEGGSAGAFDPGTAAESGCGAPTSTQLVCTLAAPLDSLLLAGMGGADSLHATGFPSTTSVVVIGGEGGDALSGGEASEDVLVDGPDTEGGGGDVLTALGGDDALLHNGGPDQLFGGNGNDLFLSNSICDGELLSGGPDRDNSSWARLEGEEVGANLGSGKAGEPGAGGEPSCASGPTDSLLEIEDLEGSNSADVLYGSAAPNQLLGHLGPDVYSAGAGEDSILANSADDDPAIDCGADFDTALIDRHPQFNDATPVNCESVQEADPNNFRIATQLPPPPPPVPKPPADTKPPQTKITAHPPHLLKARRATRRVAFRFVASERGSRFLCRLDRKPYRPCASPRAYTVRLGRHTVRIVAIDPSGNADPTPALFAFRVRRG